MPFVLKPHNKEISEKIKEGFEISNRLAVINPTGTGKTWLGLDLAYQKKLSKQK